MSLRHAFWLAVLLLRVHAGDDGVTGRERARRVLAVERFLVGGDEPLRIAADPVRVPCPQAPVKSLGLHDQQWCGPPRKGLLGHAPTPERFI